MLSAHDQFEANIAQVNDLVAVAVALNNRTTSAVRVDDVYRAAFVLSVSAIDHYVHEKVLAGMLEVAAGFRIATQSFARFQVPLTALGPNFSDSINVWLESEIRSAHSRATFQRADAIADAVRLIYPAPLWPAVGAMLGMDTKSVKATLDLIVDRRNKIAHEADCEPNGLGIKWPISEATVRDSIAFIISVVEAIESIVG